MNPAAGSFAYRPVGEEEWRCLNEEAFLQLHEVDPLVGMSQDNIAAIKRNATYFSELLSKSLQLPNLAFFAGSGTSLGDVGGPSMLDLWRRSMLNDPASELEDLTETARYVCEKVKYSDFHSPNIEHFLSSCDAFLLFNTDQRVERFLVEIKGVVLTECQSFLENDAADISAYEMLLQKLARRRVRDPRLKVFTTNYDMCFETAASNLGMAAIDGLSYTRRRRFDAGYFDYDFVKREADTHEYVQGVFQLYKIHGSVGWIRENDEIYEGRPSPANSCLIYPAKGKYQQAFIQPYLELLSRFLEYLRKRNSCLIVGGFGFNDDHLSEPIYSAIQSNPGLKIIIADYKAAESIEVGSPYWRKLSNLALKGYDITFVNASFYDFVSAIPNLKALSPAEQLAKAVRQLGGAHAG